MKLALVTGGAGAVGSNLVRALLADGQSVTVIDDLSSGRQANLPDSPHLRFIHGSVLDEAVLRVAFDRRYDAVFHLAALFANQNSVEHPQQDLLVNALGTLKILEHCRSASARRFLLASSSCVYGAASGALPEDHPRHFRQTPYAITKAMAEDYTHFFREYHGLSTVVLRYFNVYGPGELPGPYRNVIPNFIARALQKLPLIITGDGTETRDFTFVADTVAGTIAAAETPAACGLEINIGGGHDISIRTIAEQINALTANPAGIEFRERRAWDHVQRRCAVIDRARDILGYAPKVTIEEGLRHTCEWLKKNAASAPPTPPSPSGN